MSLFLNGSLSDWPVCPFLPPLEQYRYQDEDSPPLDHGFPRLTNEVRAPELVHVSEKNLSEIENVHGYVSHSHISPLKMRTASACRYERGTFPPERRTPLKGLSGGRPFRMDGRGVGRSLSSSA
ncbi:hypothetical protein COCON_G00077130 [Conger conger]|uniref:Disks large homologue 1 N-terminal PEST domain-containing protein n=1 Tax=Conger conger TaxID=82655 RepID=A0A9Q1I1K2_CONCO|nr:hypothetical protein COCON_G00077130 [Conger conger]